MANNWGRGLRDAFSGYQIGSNVMGGVGGMFSGLGGMFAKPASPNMYLSKDRMNWTPEVGKPETNFLQDIGGFLSSPVGGLVGGAIGLIGGLIGGQDESPEEIARRRIDAYIAKLEPMKQQEIKSGAKEIANIRTGAMTTASNIATRQAAAGGRINQASVYKLPAVSAAARGGSRDIRDFVMGTESKYNRLRADAEASMFGVPAEESVSDVMQNIGETLAARGEQETFFNRLERILQAKNETLSRLE